MAFYYIPSESEFKFFSLDSERYGKQIKQIKSELKKKVLSKFENKGIVFSYHLVLPLKNEVNIEIFQLEKAIDCLYVSVNNSLPYYTLNLKQIDIINDKIRKYGEFFKSENYFIEESYCYDGSQCFIFISDFKDMYYFKCDNLDKYGNEKINVQKLIGFLNDIFDLLKSAGVESKYLLM